MKVYGKRLQFQAHFTYFKYYMQIVFYEDNYFRYFWKPRGIPTTFGTHESFLDILFHSKLTIQDPKIQGIIFYLQDMFGREEEYGLVNRLDNETGGLLYFAKTPLIKQQYKQWQLEEKVHKTYIADVY